jgi:hypothetical protein
MYRKLLGLAGAAVLVIGATAGSASADPQGMGPTPNCFGNEVTFYATTYGGINNAASAYGLTIPEGHNILLSLCGRTNGVVPIP